MTNVVSQGYDVGGKPNRESDEFAWLDQSPLVEDVRRLAKSGDPLSDAALMNVAAKYFFAFVHPGAQVNPVPPREIASILHRFQRCRSLNEPDDDIEIMNILRRFAPALALSARPVVAGHVLSLLASQFVPGSGGRYLGLDLYTGSGLLVLGQYLLASRHGYESIEVWGVEGDGVAAKRAGSLLRSLGVGNVVPCAPEYTAAYEMVGGRRLSLVTSAVGAGGGVGLCDDRFFTAFAALERACSTSLQGASFFPEGLIVYSRETNASLILSRENGFQRPAEFDGAALQPQAWIVAGDVIPLHRMGEPPTSLEKQPDKSFNE